MENTTNNGPAKKIEDGLDDATASFPNSLKESAAEINRGDAKAKNYKEGAPDPQGPNYDSESENVDGDTTVNAGVFK